jgi:hypothetical protein
MTQRWTWCASVVCGAVLVAGVAGAGAAPAPAEPTRLWYRISATVTASYKWAPSEGDRLGEEVSNSWSLESNTAILLYRQCSHRDPAYPLSARDLALLAGVAPGSPCAAVRPRVPGHARVNLVEDVRFKANAKGTIAAFEGVKTWGPHRPVYAGRYLDFECPEAIVSVATLPGEATSTSGSLETASLVRSGVSPSLLFAEPVHLLFVRPAYECRDPESGKVVESQEARAYPPPDGGVLGDRVTAPHGFGGPGLDPGEDSLGFVKPIRLDGLGRRFGRTFTISGAQRWSRPATDGFDQGRATKTIRYTLRFRLCPRGGRDVRRC